MKKIIVIGVLLLLMTLGVSGCRPLWEETGADAGQTADGDDSEKEENEYKVAIVQYADSETFGQITEAVCKELDSKGRLLGVTFLYEDYICHASADPAALAEIATDLLAEQVDLVIPIAAPTAKEFKEATKNHPVPVVFAAVSDPKEIGIVENWNRPGANITGVADFVDADTTEILRLALRLQPKLQKLGLLYDSSQSSSLQAAQDAKAYCEARGIVCIEATGTTKDEILTAAEELCEKQCEAVFTPADYTVLEAQKELVKELTAAGIPQYTASEAFAQQGAFFGYSVDYEKLGAMAADMAAEVLVNGKDPAVTPVQIPKERIIVIHPETAAALGIDYSVLEEEEERLVEVPKTLEEQ